MDIDTQTRILEHVLKQDGNRVCADCQNKTPRWASLKFGIFMCLRCAGWSNRLRLKFSY